MVWKDVVIPIGTFIIGSAITLLIESLRYKKKVVVSIDPEQRCFKVYNTGNVGIVIKEVGICQDASIWFTQTCEKALQVGSDPLMLQYDEDDFWIKVESAIAGNEPKERFFCFISCADGKWYKTVSSLEFKDLWKYHEWFWGRNPDEALSNSTENDIPF